MTIGERLAALRPDERRNEYRLKEAVNHAATEIAHEYLAEIAPYIGDLELERFLRRLPGHVLTRHEVENLFAEHSAEAGAAETSTSSARCTGSGWSATFITTGSAAQRCSASCGPAKRRSSPTARCRAPRIT